MKKRTLRVELVPSVRTQAAADFSAGAEAIKAIREIVKDLSPALAAAVLADVLRDVAAAAYMKGVKP